MKKHLLIAAGAVLTAMAGAWQIEGPRVYPAGAEPTITIRAENANEKKLLAEGTIYYVREDLAWSNGQYARSFKPRWETINAEKTDDTIKFTVKLRGEHNHYFRLAEYGKLPYKGPHVKNQGKMVPSFLPGYRDFRFYTLKPDLMALRPWKGDIHQHSIRCGHAKEPPHRIPAFGRRVGFDFLALSEHKLHKPSLEAIAANENADAGMRAFPAEEFHTRPAFLHAVAVGHVTGVNEWVDAHPKEFEKLWKEEIKDPKYDKYELYKFEREIAAKASVMYRIAHNECKAKLVVFCHPGGLNNRTEPIEDPPTGFRQAAMDLFEYDAIEAFNCSQISGLRRDSFTHMYMMEQIARGRKFGWTSVSDCHSHATHTLYGKFFTVIFAKDCTTDDFAEAVKNRMSVAVRGRINYVIKEDKQNYLYFGPTRLLRYEEFLDEVYWDKHDALCRQQGELMLKLADGDESVRPEIARLKKAVNDYRDAFFAK